MVRKALSAMFISGGVFFWSLTLICGFIWIYAVYIARFSVPLANGYTLHSNNVSSKAVIYDSSRKLVIADVEDFSVSKGFVFGYTTGSLKCFLLNTRSGVLIYPISDDELYRLANSYSLRVNFTNILTLRNHGIRPYWDKEMGTSGMDYQGFAGTVA